MLTGRGQREVEGDSSIQRYLVESVTSATSIITIFDLFCRTFTMNFCVLSLAYCVYIASSIFLLQVQATPNDHQAMRKLTYCVQCLQQVRQISPGMAIYLFHPICCLPGIRAYVGFTLVIASALNNINKELTVIGIPTGMSPHMTTQNRSSPPTESAVSVADSVYQGSLETHGPAAEMSHPVFQPSLSHNFGSDALPLEPEVFETMSNLQPLSIRVGTIQETNTRSAYG